MTDKTTHTAPNTNKRRRDYKRKRKLARRRKTDSCFVLNERFIEMKEPVETKIQENTDPVVEDNPRSCVIC